jgi:DNA-binding NarL/FixJ family response regulator
MPFASRKSPVRLLLLDDDPVEMTILEHKLNVCDGCSVSLAHVETLDGAIEWMSGNTVDIILVDNRLAPGIDFRQTVPGLRKTGFVGPIGIISSDLSSDYFQRFQEFGADFRIGKDEIDRQALTFILDEFLRPRAISGEDELV